MVILRRQSEDSQRSLLEPLDILGVCISEESCDAELTTLDPDTGGIVQFIENNGPTIGGGYDDLGVIRGRARPSIGLQLPVEEFIESSEVVSSRKGRKIAGSGLRLELFQRQENLVQVQLMERNETLDVSRRSRIIELFALLHTQRVQEFPNYSPLVPHPVHGSHGEPTPLLLHTASTKTLVE